MKKSVALTGNEAVAHAMKQINPDVVAAYPITPQTSLMQRFADFVADGDVDTELILVESEHSAMSACVGASAAGSRVMTATSANGLALMWEVVYIAASTRLPIVMPVANRALSGPINIHCDHSDTMGARDSGWIQLYSENAQEAYDNTIQALRIAENKNVLLPVMVTLDGFIISHGMENVELIEDKKVREFIGEYKPKHTLLDVDNPITVGPLDLYDYYFEHKRQQAQAMRESVGVIDEVAKEFAKLSGRKYGLVEPYRLKDADIAIVALGSTCGTAKVVADDYRKRGIKAGVLKIRAFRPFDEDLIAKSLLHCKAIAILDRAEGFSGNGGPLYQDIRAAQLGRVNLKDINYIYGLGGRDIGLKDIARVYDDLLEIIKTKKVKEPVVYLGVRE